MRVFVFWQAMHIIPKIPDVPASELVINRVKNSQLITGEFICLWILT